MSEEWVLPGNYLSKVESSDSALWVPLQVEVRYKLVDLLIYAIVCQCLALFALTN